jgi:nucleotide-binding universal stress UspA family protein
MTEPIKKEILAAVDGSEGALNAVGYAARMLPPGTAAIVLFHVMPPAPPLYRDSLDAALQQSHAVWCRKHERLAAEALDRARAQARAAGFLDDDIRLKSQAAIVGVARDILAEAYRGNYDAVLMGRRGLGAMQDLFIGSVSNKVLQHAGVPLWLVEGRHLPPGLLVAVDESEHSLRAIDHVGFMLGGRGDVPVTLLHVQPASLIGGRLGPESCQGEEAEALFPFLARARRELLEAGVPAEVVRVSACRWRDPATGLLSEARQGGYGTIVMGRRGLTGAKAFFLGSVSSKLISTTRQMAVWVVP